MHVQSHFLTLQATLVTTQCQSQPHNLALAPTVCAGYLHGRALNPLADRHHDDVTTTTDICFMLDFCR